MDGIIVVLDTETTGLDPAKDEVLSVSMIDGDGSVILDTLVHPLARKRWPKAQAINGIAPSDVRDAPFLPMLRESMEAALAAADLVIGYNLEFDLRFLGVRVPEEKQFDVMREFAKVHGGYRYDGSRQWSKLVDCALHYGYTFTPHSSLEDCEATLFCYRALNQDPDYIRCVELEAERAAQAERSDRRAKWVIPLSILLLLLGLAILISSLAWLPFSIWAVLIQALLGLLVMASPFALMILL